MGTDGGHKTWIPTGESDECEAFAQLLDRCRSSYVECLEMYGRTPIQTAHLDALARYASLIRLETLRLGGRSLSKVTHQSVLRALGAFAELKSVGIVPEHCEPDMLNFLVRCGHIFDPVFYKKSNYGFLTWNWLDVCLEEATLLQFSFGASEERYASRERHLKARICSLSSLFLKRWIEVTLCLFYFYLFLLVSQGTCFSFGQQAVER